jgi:phage terminase small subunit
METKKRKLNPKQKRFVQEYIIDLNATQAAIRAGYSKRMAGYIGWQLLQKTLISAEIDRQLRKREERTQVDQDYVIKGLLNVHERCVQAVEVLDKEGNPTGEFRFEASGANKALELLGRHLKMFTDKVEIRKIKSLDDLQEDELAALLEDIRNRNSELSEN